MIYSRSLAVNDNLQPNKRAFVVDNFYKDPMAVREFALQQQFVENEYYIGRRTETQFLIPGIKEAFESIIGRRITEWESHGMNGRFQWNKAGDPLVWHSDGQRWAGMIYLTPNAPEWSGTNTYVHRASKKHHTSLVDDLGEIYNQKTFLDPAPYDELDRFGNLFNRLVIFDGQCIHAAGGYFGWDAETARLWHMFFFDAED